MKTLSAILIFTALMCGVVLAEEEAVHKSIVSLDAEVLGDIALSPVNEYPFMQVIAGDNPVAGSLNGFHSSDGKFEVGFYEGSEVTLKITDWPVHEVMVFLEGLVEITDENGASRIYGPGNALVMPKGFSGTWRQLSAIRKISVTYPED